MSDPSTRNTNEMVINGRTYHPQPCQVHASDTVSLNGQIWYAHVARRVCNSLHEARTAPGSLVDGGCNGGMAGDDCLVLDETTDTCVVHGVGGLEVSEMPIGTIAMKVDTTEGPIIGIFHQYGLHLKGKTVHSNNQLRAFGCRIEDTPPSVWWTTVYVFS